MLKRNFKEVANYFGKIKTKPYFLSNKYEDTTGNQILQDEFSLLDQKKHEQGRGFLCMYIVQVYIYLSQNKNTYINIPLPLNSIEHQNHRISDKFSTWSGQHLKKNLKSTLTLSALVQMADI